ncbi:hypothetical protein PG990_014419 [Apiospora arundinis]
MLRDGRSHMLQQRDGGCCVQTRRAAQGRHLGAGGTGCLGARETLHVPVSAQGEARVEGDEGGAGEDDHGPLDDHEDELVVGQLAAEAVLQLDEPIHGPDDDEQHGRRERVQQALEGDGVAEGPVPVFEVGRVVGRHRGAPPLALALAQAPPEVHAQHREGDEREDLEGETGDHDVDAHVDLGLVAVARGRDATTSTLQDQGDEVEGDEDPGVGHGLEAGVAQGRVEDVDDAGQAQVHAGGDEGGRDGQGDEVDEEGVEAEDVLVQHDAADVADDLAEQAERHPDAEGPGPRPDGEEEVREQDGAEQGGVHDVTGQRRQVVHPAHLETAYLRRALRQLRDDPLAHGGEVGCGHHGRCDVLTSFRSVVLFTWLLERQGDERAVSEAVSMRPSKARVSASRYSISIDR